jgi:hypothetical protein
MKLIIVALVFGFLVSVNAYSQDKTEKSCCSNEKSKTTMGKTNDVPEEVLISSTEQGNSYASVSDDKDKKTGKNLKNTDKNVKKEKSKCNSSGDGCCSPDKKKTEKIKSP